MPPSDRCAFGDYVLDRKAHEVRPCAGGQALALTPKQFDALLLFIERPNELIEKDALIAALWPGLVVEENNLSQAIAGLRRALGDDAQVSRYIQTVPRRGFRFVAPVTALDADASGTPAPVRPSRRLWLAVAGAGTLAAVGVLWWRPQTQGPGTAAPRPTLAVLPFKPLVAEGRDELLEIGMADSLIARLSTVPGLVVRSVGSVRRFSGADQDPLRAARELDVAWIVDGSLQRRGAQWRVTARLLEATSGVAAWSGTFDESAAGVFDVQDLISTRVAAALAPWLVAAAPVPPERAAAGGTRNPDAYQHYLAARHHAQGIRAAGLRRSAELYQKAIDADPAYALAYAGLVETYRRMIFGADIAPIEAFAPAEVAAQRALALAPDLAEAHAGLGWIRYWYHFDWSGAERLFRHALSLNPNTVEAHFGLGLLLLSLDRPAEGLAHLSSARQLDPMSLILNALEASFQLAQGHRAEAEKRLARAFEIDADFWVAHIAQAGLYLADGRIDAAIASLRRADELADGSTQAAALLGTTLARHGRAQETRRILERLVAVAKQRYVPPTSLAALHAALGETGPALDALDQAYAVRDTRLVYMKDDGRWAALRQEPRYTALLRRMKLDRLGAGPTRG